MQYASFWKRTAAYLIDRIIFLFILVFFNKILDITMDPIIDIYNQQGVDLPLSLILFLLCTPLAIYIVYYVIPEASSWQATVGKHILGLKVTDSSGQRISFLLSLWRNFAMFFSDITLGLGYLMCFWTKKKQSLHDILADCIVQDVCPQKAHGCLVLTSFACIILFALVFVISLVLFISHYN